MAYVLELLLPNCSKPLLVDAALLPLSVMPFICVVAADDVNPIAVDVGPVKEYNSSTVNVSAVVMVTTNVMLAAPPDVLLRENDALPTGVFEVGVNVQDLFSPLKVPPLVQVNPVTFLPTVNTIDFILYVLETLEEIVKVPVLLFAMLNAPDDAEQLEPLVRVINADFVGNE
jgi:hypothetical protein